MKGSYLLLIELKNEKCIQVGKLGKINFNNGFYIYVGSALNGLEQRIKRHLRSKKKMHWHIDYLLNYTKIIEIYYKVNDFNEECSIAKIFYKQLSSFHGFGSSDCKCKSHLFFGDKNMIKNILENLDIIKYKINAKT